MTDDELEQRFAAYAAQNQPEPTPEPVTETPEAAPETTDTEAAPAIAAEPEAAAEAAPKATEGEPVTDERAELEERLQRQYFENREAKRREKLKDQELEVLRGNRQENRDETLAREAAALAQTIATQNAFNLDCNRIAKELDKSFGGSAPIVAKFAGTFGPDGIPRPLLEAVIESGEGQEHKVIHWLSNNLDEAERIQGLTPAKQGVAIAKISARLATPKPVSNAPAPIKTVGGGVKSSDGPAKDFSKMTTSEQIKMWDEEDRKRKANRYH